MGGRGAGRSTVESQLILSRLMAPEYFRSAIMRFVLGDIRNSCFREIKDRAEEQGVLDQLTINESSMTISYGKNSIQAHGFRKSSGDQKAKLKSLANYNHIWIEEADEVPEEDFMQLDDSLRTVKGDISIHITLNPPPKSHWIIRRFFNLIDSGQSGFFIPQLKDNNDALHIMTDWHDNAQNIDIGTQKRYEEYEMTNPHHYWNMIRGYVPEVVVGRIYTGWNRIDSVPHEARLMGYGLDFGFYPDAAAIIAIYWYNGGFILDEVLYQHRLQNSDLITVLNAKPKAPIVPDSAEPKSIQELKNAGLTIIEPDKGDGSVRAGIKHVQNQRISYTKSSKNLESEYENYAWKVMKDGQEAGIEDPKCQNHAMSAVRYGLSVLKPTDNYDKYESQINNNISRVYVR